MPANSRWDLIWRLRVNKTYNEGCITSYSLSYVLYEQMHLRECKSLLCPTD